jgi:hypothetical protein
MQSSQDIRSCILNKVDTFQHLGMLARTNKAFKAQIYSCDKLWTELGKKLCGEEYWPPGNSHRHLNARQLAMIRTCPWMSEPRRFEVPLLNNIRTMGGTVSIRQMEVSHNYCTFTATLRGGGLVRDGNYVEVMTDAYGNTCRNDMISLPSIPRLHTPPTAHEIDMMRMLNATKWRPYELYPSSPMIDLVRVVHQSLFMVFCNELHRSHSIIYFVSTRTLSVLHTHRCFMRPHWKMHNVFVRPGEMWFFEDNHKNPVLTYFGPVGNHGCVNTHPERGVRDAFWAAYRGNVQHALEIFDRNGVQSKEIYRLQEDRYRLVDAVMLSKNEDALDQLLERFPDFADIFLLYKAIESGSPTMAGVLLRRGVDPADDCSEPLFRTIRSRNGSLEMYSLLVSKGARVYPCCMMYHIRPWTDFEIVHRLLLLWTGDTCAHEENPLFVHWLLNGGDYSEPMRAAAETHPELANQANENGLTPIMLAAGSLCVENVRTLIDLKADLRARDKENRSVLDWCDAAADSDLMPEWYMDAYTAFETPAAFEFDDANRSANSQAIRALLGDGFAKGHNAAHATAAV